MSPSVGNTSDGAEYLYGSRFNLDGRAGFAHRMQIAFQYNS